MAFDSTPWFVGGGAQHSPEVARTLAYASTNGAEGITGLGDLKVEAQAVPNGTVRVAPGAGLVLNRYAGGGQQTYVLRNATQTDVPITATGSGGGRTDMVVARILDPQYEGMSPADPVTFQYARPEVLQGVSATAKTPAEAGFTAPAIALARVTLPVSTATVTSAMITDLRKVANPRRERLLDTGYWETPINVDTTAYKHIGTSTTFEVPPWATAAKVVLTYSGLALMVGNTTGWLRGLFNNIEIRPTFFDENWLAAGSFQRTTYAAAGEIVIPPAMRGNSYTIQLQGKRDSGPGYLQARSGTSVAFDIEFAEKAY
jgi:hypothetical protein